MNYNWPKKDKPNWHSYSIGGIPTLDEMLSLYEKISDWIIETVDGPYRHALWKIDINDLTIKVRFRYERDFINFVLKWGR